MAEKPNVGMAVCCRIFPLHNSSVIKLVNVDRAIIRLLLVSFSDRPSSVRRLPRYAYDVTCSNWLM